MSLTAVLLLVFFAMAAAVIAGGLVLRDLRGARLASQPQAAAPTLRLQRLKPAVTEPDDAGPIAAFDGWFTQLLADAGLDWNPTIAASVMILWATICGMSLFVFDERLVPAMVTGLIAGPLPLVVLSFIRARRVAKLQDQLPAALEILARSMRAGQSLDQAIKLLGEHLPQPLAGEFRWCAQQMAMGLALPAVMRCLVRRVRIYDVRILATTLIVHRQTGGNVVNVLERLAQVVRERLNYRRQLRATTAAGRMSAGLVGLVGPCVFIYFFFFRPDYVNTMLQSPLGQSLLALAVALEVVGLVWTARLLKPTY